MSVNRVLTANCDFCRLERLPVPQQTPERPLHRVLAVCVQLLLLLLFVCIKPAHAQTFLEAEQAFPVRVTQAADNPSLWLVEFRVANGYYLYRDKLAVKRPDGEAGLQPAVDIPAGVRKYDENLSKEVETLRDTVTLSVRWSDTPPAAVDVHSQGCADAGLCYPPAVQRLKPQGAAGASFFGAAGVFGRSGADAATAPATSPGAGPVSLDASGSLADRLAQGRTAATLAVFFGLGVLLAFTPCVLPMVPILSAVIVGQQQTGGQQGAGHTDSPDGSAAGHGNAARSQTSASSRRWRSFALALSYVAGMSLVYTAVGVVAGLTGEGLVAALQTPAILFSFAVFLFVFGVAMLGGWDMQLPLSVQNWVNERSSRLQGGQFLPVFVMGGLSAVLVGPCVAPPLAGALLYLSTTGDWMLGGAALMALSWGLGAPLIVAAAAADRVLPRAGAWMESVKRFFGFLLMALAIYTLAPVVSSRVLMALWSVFLLVSAASAGALTLLPASAGMATRLQQGFAWVLLLAGVMQGVGAGLGADDVFRPLAPLVRSGASAALVPDSGAASNASQDALPAKGLAGVAGDSKAASSRSVVNPHGLPFRRVGAAEAEQVIATLGQPAFLDFYADWCVACKEMERFTFTDRAVQTALAGVVWLQVDVTDNTAADKALLKRFRLFGPPGIVFFDAQGREIAGARVVGFQNAETFAATVRGVYQVR